MSHYLDFKTVMTDSEALRRALLHMETPAHCNGLPASTIEVHKTAQHLYGYENDQRDQTAEVIIRKANVQQSANDIGFAKQPDGTYKAIISEYDRRQYFRDDWLTRLSTYYNYEKSKIELENRKVQYQEMKDSKGRLQLKVVFKTKAVSAQRITL